MERQPLRPHQVGVSHSLLPLAIHAGLRLSIQGNLYSHPVPLLEVAGKTREMIQEEYWGETMSKLLLFFVTLQTPTGFYHNKGTRVQSHMVYELAEDKPVSEEPCLQKSWDVVIAASSIFILTQEEIVAHTGPGINTIHSPALKLSR